jgi:hypothetical protein
MKFYELNSLLEKMALEGRRYFSPKYICDRLQNADLKEVTNYLLSNSYSDIVIPSFEIECPDGDSDFIVTDPSLIPTELRICHLCGMEYVPSPKRIWLTFNFTEEFKQYVKKKNYMSTQKIQTLTEAEIMAHAL